MIMNMMSNLLLTATTGAAGSTPADGGWLGMLMSFAPFILIFVLMYFMMIRPQKKKDKAVKDMLAALKNGDRVCTIGGFYGTIVRIKDQVLTIEVGEQKTQMMIARWAVRNVEQLSVTNDSETLI